MSLELSRARALCFDVDGTLRDTDDQYVAQLARALGPMRFLFRSGDPSHLARRVVMALESPGTLMHSLPDRLGLDEKLAGLADWLQRVVAGQDTSRYLVVPGVVEALHRLAARYPLAIVTARNERQTLSFLDRFQLTGLFQAIATAHTCAHTKPYPDPLWWVAQRLGVPASALVMIGDTTADMRAGKSAGAQAVGVLCGFGQEQELRRAGADLIIRSTPDLAGVMLGVETGGPART